MNRTVALSSPVITLLSPSPVASRKAQSVLSALCSLEDVPLNKNQSSENDELDEAFQSSIPGFSRSWDSVASRSPNSGAMILFCSMQNANNSNPKVRIVTERQPFLFWQLPIQQHPVPLPIIMILSLAVEASWHPTSRRMHLS
jgi:hypothetical protein